MKVKHLDELYSWKQIRKLASSILRTMGSSCPTSRNTREWRPWFSGIP